MISVKRPGSVRTSELRLDDFQQDEPYSLSDNVGSEVSGPDMIDGVRVRPLAPSWDARGSLCELLTTRDGTIEPIVHVYQVSALPGSRRAWVFHRRQDDRLAFTCGQFKIALYDVRPNSPTFSMLNVFEFGVTRPTMLRIPALVIHGVHNFGNETSTFVNLPTRAWDPRNPDKWRLPEHDPRIPFDFDAP